MLRAVIFDLGGVVLGSPLHAFADYEREIGLPHNSLNRLIVENGESSAWSGLERGKLTMEAFFTAFDAEVRAAGHEISAADLMARVAAASAPRPEMVRAVDRIRASGLKVAALTNNWASDDQTRKMDLLRDHFDVFLESVREGLQKPDPRIYRLVCARLEVEPTEAVFLDDIGRNLKPARAMGMTTIKVDDPGPALVELSRLLGLPLA